MNAIEKKPNDTLIIAITWCMAGGLFGSLFAGLYQLLMLLGLPGWGAAIAGAGISAMTTAAFYSAMPIALVGAMAGMAVSIAYLIATGHQIRLVAIAGLAGIGGLVAGMAYSWLIRSRVHPFSQTLAGLVSGVAAGAVAALLAAVAGPEPGMLLLAPVTVILVGGLYGRIQPGIVTACANRVPPKVSIPLVSALIGAVVGASIWIVGGTTTGGLSEETLGSIDYVLSQVPAGFLGGLIGGGIIGVVLERLGMAPMPR